jgi:hypothetical protein
MGDLGTQALLFLVVTLAVGMVTGACRATSLEGVLRESLRSFAALSGGIVLLCVALQLILIVVQSG